MDLWPVCITSFVRTPATAQTSCQCFLRTPEGSRRRIGETELLSQNGRKVLGRDREAFSLGQGKGTSDARNKSQII